MFASLLGLAPLAHAATATFSATYQAPYCSGANASCDTGTLVNARGNQTGGPEQNQPNTINDSCADGAYTGAYHVYESNDRVSIATNDGSPLGPGKTVTVSTTVWCRNTADRLDLYYAASIPGTGSPAWTLINTQACTASGARTFTDTYTLPSTGTTHAVRAQFRYSGASSNACYSGTVQDRDDLVFDLSRPNDSSFVSQTPPPPTMTAGQTANVSVTMQNTGTNTWTQTGNYSFGSQNPPDNTNWGFGRVNLDAGDSIALGQQKTFNFTITAPAVIGTYNFQWQMVQDGVEWFGATSPNVAVTVSLNPDTTNPSTPAGVSAVTVSQSSIDLSWNASTDPVIGGQTTSGIAGYWVYRNGSATPVNASLITGTSYTDGGLSTQTSYTYTVRAQDNAGNQSGLSSSAGATTLPPPNVSGYAWADDIIGWIHLSGTALDTSPYGVLVSSASPGVLSGYAWANPNDSVAGTNNIGWISFNANVDESGTLGCPSNICTAQLNRSTGQVSGWARACSVFASGCSGALRASSELGGWDGWIKFGSGGNYTQPVTVSGCNWSGYAWGGGTTIGWIHFGGASYSVTGSGDGCTALPDLTAGSVSPTVAVAGEETTFSATISNTGIGSTGSGFTNLFQFDDNADHNTVFATLTDTSPALTTGGTDVSQVSYPFPTSGTWYVRACADNNASFVGTISESDENNNCGAWTEVTVTLPQLTGTFFASPASIDPGGSSTLTWTSNATSCIGIGFSTGGLANSIPPGVSTGPLASSQNYQITCSKSGYEDLTLATTVTVISITASINAKPSCISGGGSSKVSWSVLPATQIQAGSCTLSGPGLSSNPLPVSPDGSTPNASPQTVAVPSSRSTYTISCTTTGGAVVTKSATVDVTSCWAEF